MVRTGKTFVKHIMEEDFTMKRMKILTVLFVAMLMCSACSADKKEPVETDNTVSVAQEVVTPKQ